MIILHWCAQQCNLCLGSGEGMTEGHTCWQCHGKGYFGRGEVEIHVSPSEWMLPDNPIYCEVCGKDLKEGE